MDNSTFTLLAILLIAVWACASDWGQRREYDAAVASLMKRRAEREVKGIKDATD